MPIKEFVIISSLVVGWWYAIGGMAGVQKNLLQAKIAILRDVARTDNWGNPSIFPHKGARSKNEAAHSK